MITDYSRVAAFACDGTGSCAGDGCGAAAAGVVAGGGESSS